MGTRLLIWPIGNRLIAEKILQAKSKSNSDKLSDTGDKILYKSR